MIPGKSSSFSCSMRMKLSRISCLTVFETQPLSRSCLRFDGRLAGVTQLPPPSIGPSTASLLNPPGSGHHVIVGGRVHSRPEEVGEGCASNERKDGKSFSRDPAGSANRWETGGSLLSPQKVIASGILLTRSPLGRG